MGRNIDACISKMNKIANFWQLLNPSLPGRINLAKTYLYPQIAYPCAIIQPTQTQLNEMEDIIFKFVKQREIVSRSKIFSERKSGGLGLPLPLHYIQSLDILLFKKGLHISDTWTHELFFHCNNKDRFFFTKIPDIKYNPIISRIISNYIKFSESFWTKHGNILDIRVFNNHKFTMKNGQKMSKNFFSASTWNNFENLICKLKFKNILKHDFSSFDSSNSFRIKTGIEITGNDLFNINKIIKDNVELYNDEIKGPQCEISTFLNLPKTRILRIELYRLLESFLVFRILIVS